MRNSGTFLLALFIALLLGAAGLAAPLQAADGTLAKRVEAFLRAQSSAADADLRIEVFTPAAHFPDCASPEPFLPRADAPLLGRVTVGLRCGSSGRVRYLSAELSMFGSYLTLSEAVAPGTVITEALLETRRGDLSRLPPQALNDPALVLGKTARQRLGAGLPLLPQQLRSETLVEPGREVTIESRGQGFSIRRSGQALERGGMGESVRVRVPHGPSLKAVVSGPDLVTIKP